jgi:uncharacterized protein YceK
VHMKILAIIQVVVTDGCSPISTLTIAKGQSAG